MPPTLKSEDPKKHIEKMEEEALKKTISHIDRRVYVSDDTAMDYLTKEMKEFLIDYWDADFDVIDPEFNERILDEYEKMIRSYPGMKVIRLSEEEASSIAYEYEEIYGFDEDAMKKAHHKVYKRKEYSNNEIHCQWFSHV